MYSKKEKKKKTKINMIEILGQKYLRAGYQSFYF